MKIDKLQIKGLYGYIDKDIHFNSDLTILVGINGSGKTSILNIISWLLTPSIPHLCITEFRSLKLFFQFKENKYEINCKHINNALKYYIKTQGDQRYNPLIVKLQSKPGKYTNLQRANLLKYYEALSPDSKEEKTWNLISFFPTPTVVGLDRNLCSDDEYDEILVEDKQRKKLIRERSPRNITPIEKVKELINKEYRKSKNSILKLTDDLKNYLMLSTFDGSISLHSFRTGIKQNLDIKQIDSAESRLNDYFKNLEKKYCLTAKKKKFPNIFLY